TFVIKMWVVLWFSVFLGELLEKILTNIEKGVASQATEAQIINLGVGHIPDISKDYTDRNRTSPFAFTGNKFEFRAVGASANVGVPVSILNAAVAESFQKATEDLKSLLAKKPGGRDEAVMELIRLYTTESKAIRFGGNNYSEAWQKEANERGLPVLPRTPEAVATLNNAKATDFLIKMNVLSAPEIHARYHVAVERYNKTISIEMVTLRDLAQGHILPALEAQISEVVGLSSSLTHPKAKAQSQARLGELEELYSKLLTTLNELSNVLSQSEKGHSEEDLMKLLADKAIPLGADLRKLCDQIEMTIGDKFWPLPKYRELLFSHALS
ncbi:glutamine synthetase type III, partial [bacterium]|nr:glutamine synthetase type III [bacterium]